jgi:hypothetical protein
VTNAAHHITPARALVDRLGRRAVVPHLSPAAETGRQPVGAYGLAGVSTSAQFVDYARDPDFLQQPPIEKVVFNSADNYPSAVGYWQQRRVFANSNTNPNRVWASQTGRPTNFNISVPVKDDDAVQFDLVSDTVDEIRTYLRAGPAHAPHRGRRVAGVRRSERRAHARDDQSAQGVVARRRLRCARCRRAAVCCFRRRWARRSSAWTAPRARPHALLDASVRRASDRRHGVAAGDAARRVVRARRWRALGPDVHPGSGRHRVAPARHGRRDVTACGDSGARRQSHRAPRVHRRRPQDSRRRRNTPSSASPRRSRARSTRKRGLSTAASNTTAARRTRRRRLSRASITSRARRRDLRVRQDRRGVSDGNRTSSRTRCATTWTS